MHNFSPRVSPDAIRDFLERYGGTEFRHRDEVLALMRGDDPYESRITATEGQLDESRRLTFRTRAETTAFSQRTNPTFPIGLADDVRAVSIALDGAADQRLRFWNVALPSGVLFMILELVDDRRLAGCIAPK